MNIYSNLHKYIASLLFAVCSWGFLSSCSHEKQNYTPENLTPFSTFSNDTSSLVFPCKWDSILTEKGLIDIKSVDSSIIVNIKYATDDNFMKKNLYGCLNKCYLQPDVAKKLKQAQSYLKQQDSLLSLLVYDGLRPRSVQQKMWDALDMPLYEKSRFVSNPSRGSLHNFGAAVDVTIINIKAQTPLDMGTPYDYIGIEAWPIKEQQMLKSGKLDSLQVANRKLLRKVMTKAGFFNIQSEWWHFNSCYRKEAYKKYDIIE